MFKDLDPRCYFLLSGGDGGNRGANRAQKCVLHRQMCSICRCGGSWRNWALCTSLRGLKKLLPNSKLKSGCDNSAQKCHLESTTLSLFQLRYPNHCNLMEHLIWRTLQRGMKCYTNGHLRFTSGSFPWTETPLPVQPKKHKTPQPCWAAPSMVHQSNLGESLLSKLVQPQWCPLWEKGNKSWTWHLLLNIDRLHI